MDPDRWRRIEKVYEAALACSPADRPRFLTEACAEDPLLRAEVESLLAQIPAAEQFLETPAFETAARAVAEGSRPLSPGTTVGSYEILSQVGAGGMGEVYRARDARLNRDVAIKVLSPLLLPDRESRVRFEREARLLASVNHPNIATIYGVEEIGSDLALVLELIEGPTLADWIRQSPRRPLAECLSVVRQIAEGLEAAHEKGIVHRDLKPANVKVADTGIVKVVDFGLAKSADSPREPTGSASATATTHIGAVMGTVAYMSPEQARGQPTDKRTDIWAFGCVMYEVLCGRPAFRRDTTPDTIAAVLGGEPDWSALSADVPPGIRRLIARCLEKDRKQRLRDIGDARIEIDDASEPFPQALSPARIRRPAVLAAIVALAVFASGLAGWSIAHRPAPLSESRGPVEFRASFPSDHTPLLGLAVSPSGRHVVLGTFSAGLQVWLLSLSSPDMRLLPGTTAGSWPFWSPDDTRVGVFVANKLMRVDLATGQPVAICEVHGARGGSWNRDGTIVFSWGGRLFQVHESGGTPKPLYVEDPAGRVVSRLFPQFLPDGRHFLYHERGTGGGFVRVGSLSSPESKTLLESSSVAAFAPPGYLLFIQGTALVAQRLNLETLTLEGEATAIAENVAPAYLNGYPLFSASSNGVLAYVGALAGSPGELTWFDRGGRSSSAVDHPPDVELLNPAFSPAGDRIAVNRMEPRTGNWDVWVLDLPRDVSTRLTVNPAQDTDAVWSPDGKAIAFGSTRDGSPALYSKTIDVTGVEERLYQSKDPDTWLIPWHWTPDNRYLVFGVTRQSPILWQLWALPLFGERTPVRLFADDAIPRYGGRVSPDGKWIAYASAESGRFEVYVQRFMAPGQKTQVSRGGGIHPRWRSDGRELFYWARPLGVASVGIQISGEGFRAGAPATLIPTPIRDLIDGRPHYDVRPDGRRFLLRQPAGPAASTATIVLNWTERLKK